MCLPSWAGTNSGQPPDPVAPSSVQDVSSGPTQSQWEEEQQDYFLPPRPVSSFNDYTPRRGPLQQNCPMLWCAPNFYVALIDNNDQNLIPGVKSGYTHLKVDRQPKGFLLHNDRPHRVMVLFSVNQRNPVDGKKAVMASRGYIVPARSGMLVELTKLEGSTWFAPSWPQEGRININVYNETPVRPMDGGPPPLAPPEAREYLVENGKRYWVPPTNFPFRYDRGEITPAATLFLTYDINFDRSLVQTEAGMK